MYVEFDKLLTDFNEYTNLFFINIQKNGDVRDEYRLIEINLVKTVQTLKKSIIIFLWIFDVRVHQKFKSNNTLFY